MAKKSAAKVTARMLLDLLATRHSGDVFVPECKDGPSQGCKHLRMDAWAMTKSWAHPHVFGYEIKVSRADFLGDNKWRAYLPYCNSFSFVTAPGVIKSGELPEDTGLIVSSSTGSCLLTKKKAPYRDVEIPENVWRYVLMCRTKVAEEHTSESSREFWSQWVEGKRDNDLLGYRVGRKLKEVISKQIDQAKCDNYRLQRDLEKLQDIRTLLAEEFGFDPKGIVPEDYAVRRKLKRSEGEVSGADRESLIKSLGNARNFIEQSLGWLEVK